MPMNEAIKADWLKALRSGEYEQARDFLAKKDKSGKTSYCCLGVLCDMAVKAGVEVKVTTGQAGPYADGTEFKYIRYDYVSGSLPESVMKWAGLPESEPRVIRQGQTEDEDDISLPVLNDGGGDPTEGAAVEPHDFARIADLIEADASF
jgi:hypothetical protein